MKLKKDVSAIRKSYTVKKIPHDFNTYKEWYLKMETDKRCEYSNLVRVADSLYNSKDFRKSGDKYSEAFKVNSWKGLSNDRYNAACSWALASMVDSAFYQLDRIANQMNYINYSHITTDPDLNSLHNDNRWEPLLNKIKQNKEIAEANLNKPLVAILDSIYIEDQKYRQQISGIEKKYGGGSKEMKDHWKLIKEKRK